MLLWILTAAVLLAAAGYAQFRIARYTAGATRVAFARAVLIVVGIAFGYAAAKAFADGQSIPAWLVFLTGFGLVHLPAAIILFIKRERDGCLGQFVVVTHPGIPTSVVRSVTPLKRATGKMTFLTLIVRGLS